jgi:hypothetical protein
VSDQHPPAWNPDNTSPYGAPPPQQYPPAQPPAQPYGAPPHQTAPLPQYGPPLQYGPPPQYDPPPQYGTQYGGQPPQYDPYRAQPPAKRPKGPWLAAAAAAVVLALVGGAVVLLTRGGDDTTADAPVPTATFTDGVSTPTVSPSTDPPSAVPSTTAPSVKPTTPERRRTLKDVDKGILVYDDVYVAPASGWRKSRSTTYSVTLGATTKAGAAMAVVSPAGIAPRTAVVAVAQALIKADHLKAVKQGAVRTVSPANSNIGAEAEMAYSGRYTAPDGTVFSMVARCTTMTGVESIHNVTVTLCVAARKDAQKSVFRDGDRMLASLARSI